jgi:hypothetical protein
MNNTIEKTVTNDETSVSRLAYQLWENAGRPLGRDLEFWLAAEVKVRVASHSAPSTPAVLTPALRLQEKSHKAPRASSGTKKSWPKPYPNLPKF